MTKKPPLEVFPGHPSAPGPAFGCDRDCRAWLKTQPGIPALKDAILVELDRGPRVRLAIWNSLLTRLMREERGALVKRINLYLGKR